MQPLVSADNLHQRADLLPGSPSLERARIARVLPPTLKLRRTRRPNQSAVALAKAGAGDDSRKCEQKESTQSGFTLIEVLVALTILSISLGVLLAVFTQGLDRARESRNEAAARVLAQSLLAQARIEPNPAIGTNGGRTNNLLWHLSIEPWGSKDDRSAWHENVAQIQASVSWLGDGGTRTIRLSTLRFLAGGTSNNNSDDTSDQ